MFAGKVYFVPTVIKEDSLQSLQQRLIEEEYKASKLRHAIHYRKKDATNLRNLVHKLRGEMQGKLLPSGGGRIPDKLAAKDIREGMRWIRDELRSMQQALKELRDTIQHLKTEVGQAKYTLKHEEYTLKKRCADLSLLEVKVG
jgi:hypothetical protein